MPTVTLPDGTNVFIDSNDPKEIERQKENYRKEKLSRASGSSTLGDIARAVPAAGISAVTSDPPAATLALGDVWISTRCCYYTNYWNRFTF